MSTGSYVTVPPPAQTSSAPQQTSTSVPPAVQAAIATHAAQAQAVQQQQQQPVAPPVIVTQPNPPQGTAAPNTTTYTTTPQAVQQPPPPSAAQPSTYTTTQQAAQQPPPPAVAQAVAYATTQQAAQQPPPPSAAQPVAYTTTQQAAQQPPPPSAAQPVAYTTTQQAAQQPPPPSAAQPVAYTTTQQAAQQPPPPQAETRSSTQAYTTSTQPPTQTYASSTPQTPPTTTQPAPSYYAAPPTLQPTATQQQPGAPPSPTSTAPAPRTSVARVKVVKAKGLPKEMFVKPADSFCTCRVPGRPETEFRTPVVNNSSNPEWNFEREIHNYGKGEPLEFLVVDKGRFSSDKPIGRGVLNWPPDPTKQNGFRGPLPLTGTGAAKGSEVEVQVDIQEAATPPPPAVAGSPAPACGSTSPAKPLGPEVYPGYPSTPPPKQTTTVVSPGVPCSQTPPVPMQWKDSRDLGWDPFMVHGLPQDSLTSNPFMAPQATTIVVQRPPHPAYASSLPPSPGFSLPSGLDSPVGSPLRPFDAARPCAPWEGDLMEDGEWMAAYRSQVQAFLARAAPGVRCRTLVPQAALVWRATYSIAPRTGTLRIAPVGLSGLEVREVNIEGIKNIWIHGDPQVAVCASPEIERLMRSMELQLVSSELRGLMLLDTEQGPVALLENSFRQREDFLDCIAVICATLQQRHQHIRQPVAPWASSPTPYGFRPPPIQQWPPQPLPLTSRRDRSLLLRQEGCSLQSIHITGAAGLRLAAVGEPIVPDVQVV